MDPPDGPLVPLAGVETLFRVLPPETRFRPYNPGHKPADLAIRREQLFSVDKNKQQRKVV